MRKNFKRRSKRTGKYKSKLESLVARMLRGKATYESERIKYVLPKNYTPDFVVLRQDGTKIFVEVKGYHRYEDQAKMRAVKQSNPELDIRMFFPKDGKVQSSEMTNSEWCIKYGFPYAIEKLPKDWLT
jgi:hypothetical protein